MSDEELDPKSLAAERAEPLPEREAMSLIGGGAGMLGGADAGGLGDPTGATDGGGGTSDPTGATGMEPNQQAGGPGNEATGMADSAAEDARGMQPEDGSGGDVTSADRSGSYQSSDSSTATS